MPGIPATAELPEPSKAEPQVLAQPEVDNAPVPAELPKAKKSKMAAKANVAAKAPKSKKHSAGYFSVVKTECVMHREPAGDSTVLIKVKPARKLWVEDENQEWVRGFRKSGDVGYFEKSCFE